MTALTEWNRKVEALFQAALDLPQDERAAFITAEAGGDDALAQEVHALLTSYASASETFLDLPAHGLTLAPAPQSILPETIGRYRILGKIGTGGMGVVYRAEQQNPRREIALKVMRPGMTSGAALRRFELEAALLARLAHPGIAQVIEAGTYVDDGDPRPYFAMELVEGAPLMEYVQARRPGTRARLELLASICDAVQFAHQKGIIHRDLKPSNIIVVEAAPGTDVGASRTSQPACPKILDFGVARTTDADIQTTTMHTEVGQVLGTLAYMSPEQIAADTRDIDTRSDVYALGVIIYEVLTGKLPIDVNHKTIGAAARLICESEPPTLGAMDRTLRGDLSTIVQKALEKDPARRYASAGELAADLRRFLNDEPIAARRTTTLYQLRKFAGRNRGLVAGSLAALVMLIIGAAVSTTLAVLRTRALAESERQRNIAEQALIESDKQRDIAQAVSDFVNNDLLGQANPYLGGKHDARVRDVLDGAAKAIDSRLLDKPLVHASIRATLGKTYYQLGAYDESDAHLKRAIELYAEHLGHGDPLTNDLRQVRIQGNLMNFKLQEAEVQMEELLRISEEQLGPLHPMTAKAYGALGILRKRQGNFPASEKAYRRALDVLAQLPQADERTVAIVKENLGLVLFDQGKNTEAELLVREAADELERIAGPDSADLAYALTNLGQIYKKSRPKKEGLELALECFERAYVIRRERLGDDHRETLRTRFCHAMALADKGNHAESERMHREILERRMHIMEEDHIDVLESRHHVAKAMEEQGEYAESAEIYRDIVRLSEARYGPEYYIVRRFRWAYADQLRETENQSGLHEFFNDYFAALEKATASSEAKAGDLNAYAYWLLFCDTECLRDPAKALTFARRAYELTGPNHPNVPYTYASALSENGDFDEAVAVLEEARTFIPSDATERQQSAEEQLASIRAAQRAGS